MIVKAISNSLDDVPKKAQEFAHPRGENDLIDVSPGKHYAVFAVMENEYGAWYLVHTDTMNAETLWWMPSSLYTIIDDARPRGWTDKKEENKNTIISAYPTLHEELVEEGIIDGEKKAMDTYMAEVKSDPSFPTERQIEELNQEFFKQKRMRKYEAELKLAEERGYEYPNKPEA